MGAGGAERGEHGVGSGSARVDDAVGRPDGGDDKGGGKGGGLGGGVDVVLSWA